jgi:BirA family biotin operon repressor/biotin-[acetyl-CoA-carboxylase] ligase
LEHELDPERLQALLQTQRWGRSLTCLESTASTMDEAQKAASCGAPDGHVVVADAQTRGRGAHGRAWDSPAGTDLYFSVVTRTGLPASDSALLTLAIGLGVRETVAGLTPSRKVQIKWPNDIWIDGRKCAGILVESRTVGSRLEAVVVGVGVNVNRLRWPDELQGLATSIRAESEAQNALDRGSILVMLLLRLEQWVDRLVEEGAERVVGALRPQLALLDQPVTFDGARGVFRGVADDGAALVATEDGLRTLRAGQLRPA